jgi:hypothetical protein
VALASGLNGTTHNHKTGPMVQVWILRLDREPMEAARANVDDAVCGDCKLRGDSGFGRACYVTLWLGPLRVYRMVGRYPAVTLSQLESLMARKQVRLGAYGDPAAVPLRVWRAVLRRAAGWTGYTHQWQTCDPAFREFLMASVDTLAEAAAAHAAGWRTFRVRTAHAAVLPDEVICPASDEAGHHTTCSACELCRGTANPARSVVIAAHGSHRAASFFRSAAEAARICS